jgi:hypothetical protein
MMFKSLLSSNATVLKYVLVGVAFLGLVGWNTSLQRRLTERETVGKESTRARRSVGESARNQPSFVPAGELDITRFIHPSSPTWDTPSNYELTPGYITTLRERVEKSWTKIIYLSNVDNRLTRVMTTHPLCSSS